MDKAATPIDKLDSNNYQTWKLMMEMVLLHQDLWNIVDGSWKKPAENHGEYQNWMKKAAKARALIILSLHISQLEHVRKLEHPQEIWEKLKEVHEPTGRQHRLYLRRKFFTMKMQEGDHMQDHINKIKSLQDKLESMGGNLQDEDVLTVLLASLPESYETLVITLESQAEITEQQVIVRLLQEEARRKETHEGSSKEGEAFYMQKQFPGVKKNSKGKKTQQIDKSKDTCHACGKVGHWANECRNKHSKKNKKYKKNNQEGQANEAEVLDAFFTSNISKKVPTTTWYIDSGTSEHLSPDKTLFYDLEPIHGRRIRVGNDDIITAQFKGKINLNIGEKQEIFSNVLYAPGIAKNLLAVSRLTAAGFRLNFVDNYCDIMDNNNTLLIRVLKSNNIYPLPQEDTANFIQVKYASLGIWHKKLGHLGYQNVKLLKNKDLAEDINFNDEEEIFCEACLQGKQHKLPFPLSTSPNSTELLQLVHSDICGPMNIPSIGGGRYFILFIDDKSRYTWIYILQKKSEALEVFKIFKSLAENLSGRKIKIFRTDNGTEYLSKAFQNFLKEHGIQHQTTIPYTPQQNGVAERANRTIVECARTMIHAQGLGKEFWGEAVVTATYLKNRSPTKSTDNNRTPYEVWTGRKPSLGHLQIFGCTAYTFIPKEKRTKFDSKTQKTIFVGYCEDSKGYRLYDPLTKKIIKSRNVYFNIEEESKKDNDKIKEDFTIDEVEENIPIETIQEDLHQEDIEEDLPNEGQDNEIPTQEPLRRSTRIKKTSTTLLDN